MKDWIGYLKEYVNSDLWGCVLLDYYHHQREQGAKESPLNFINAVISEMPKEVIDPVAFHNMLLSICVHLLSPNFPDIMEKSIGWIKELQNPLGEEQFQAILLHYAIYGKQEIFKEKLKSSGFDIENTIHFVNRVLPQLPMMEIDLVVFHYVFLTTNYRLLGNDFTDIMEKSIKLVRDSRNRLSEEQLQSILQHYSAYNKEAVFEEKLVSSVLGISEFHPESKSAEDKNLELRGMRVAIEAANKCESEDERIHPKVGVVIIKDKQFVCTAYRGELTLGEHAEYTALAKKCRDRDLTGATLITTLEPCTTRSHGKQPCVLHIVDSGVTKVIIGMLDPNREIRGKGVIFLQGKNIKVEVPSECQEELIRLNKKYWDQEIKKYKLDVMKDIISQSEKHEDVQTNRTKIGTTVGKGNTANIQHFPISEGFHQKLSPEFIQDPFMHARLLQYYSRNSDLVRAQPFKGKRLLFVLHFLRDFIPFVKAAVNLGLEMKNACFFYKDYPYPQKEAVREWLEKQFTNEKASPVVKPRSHISQFLKQFAESSPKGIGRTLIIEDGGFFVPLTHREFPQLISYIIGAVEQTTRGIRNAEDWEEEEKENKLQFPVISVATSELKRKFEPPYIAEAVVDNIKKLLPFMTLKGKKSALFGYGAIGEKLAHCLRQNGVIVTIFEPNPENQLQAQQAGFPALTSSVEAVQNKDFVIGTSGKQSINSQIIANLAHGTYILSASSELYEIDIEELQAQQIEMKSLRNESGFQIGTTFVLPQKNKDIHLLANGYPINFWGFDSMPEEASSLIMTLILLCSVEVALGYHPACGVNSDVVNQIAKKYKLADKFLEFYG